MRGVDAKRGMMEQQFKPSSPARQPSRPANVASSGPGRSITSPIGRKRTRQPKQQQSTPASASLPNRTAITAITGAGTDVDSAIAGIAFPARSTTG